MVAIELRVLVRVVAIELRALVRVVAIELRALELAVRGCLDLRKPKHLQNVLGATRLVYIGDVTQIQEWSPEMVLASRPVLGRGIAERLVPLKAVAAGRCGIRFWSTYRWLLSSEPRRRSKLGVASLLVRRVLRSKGIGLSEMALAKPCRRDKGTRPGSRAV